MIYGDDGLCEIWTTLSDLEKNDPALFYDVTSFLWDELPVEGPPPAATDEDDEDDGVKTKWLDGDILEFCLDVQAGVAYRLLWFRGDSPREIVCATSFTKTGAHPAGIVERIKKLRKKYLREERLNRLMQIEGRPDEQFH